MAVDAAIPRGPQDRRTILLRLLADAHFHSGEKLADAIGVSRAAVWKQVQSLSRVFGVEVDAVRGRGYRLVHPLELLDRERILSLLARDAPTHLQQLEVLESVSSTNAYLMGRRLDERSRGIACLAEQQTAGRGRRGRAWVSPFGSNIYLSLLWRFDAPPVTLAGLSLAAGVAVARAVAGVGVDGVALKWPNDLLWGGRKLGGILVELTGESDGPTHAVIGVGINRRMPGDAARAIDQPWIDLAAVTPATIPSRNLLAARLIDALVDAAARFRDAGLAPFLAPWRELDSLLGQPVRVLLGDRVVDGTGLGVASNGALRVATPNGEREFYAGEVSLRGPDAA